MKVPMSIKSTKYYAALFLQSLMNSNISTLIKDDGGGVNEGSEKEL